MLDLQTVNVGDKLGFMPGTGANSGLPVAKIGEIVRLTATQLVLRFKDGAELRFMRRSGEVVGENMSGVFGWIPAHVITEADALRHNEAVTRQRARANRVRRLQTVNWNLLTDVQLAMFVAQVEGLLHDNQERPKKGE